MRATVGIVVLAVAWSIGLWTIAYRAERRLCWAARPRERHMRFWLLGCDAKVGTNWYNIEDSNVYWTTEACGQRLRICTEEESPLVIPE